MKLKIKERKINDLISAEYNPRQITEQELKELQDSIKRFGVVEPILVNINKERKDIIISGHQRLKACLTLDMKEVPVIELNLSLEKEKYDLRKEHDAILDSETMNDEAKKRGLLK